MPSASGLVLTSLMVKLRCESFAERANIPAFIFFFQMLYPFSVGESAAEHGRGRRRRLHAGARRCLRKAGGIEVIRGALIDDCALAKALKAHGPIWLGLTERVRSIRPYPALADIRRMVVRSAYAQLRYSPLLLAGNRRRHGADLSGSRRCWRSSAAVPRASSGSRLGC